MTKIAVLSALMLAAAAGCGNSPVNALSQDGGPTGTGGTGVTGVGGRGPGGGAGGSQGGPGGAAGQPDLGTDAGTTIGSAQCSNGVDDDGDNLPDYLDPECVGPLDNDESSFATGISGDNMDACKQDCFFDGNSGGGQDCNWQLKCDPLNTNARCPYDADYVQRHPQECSVSASQSQDCVNKCRPLVPNGCDCFGCCVVPGVNTPIRLAEGCTAADFNNPAKCPACTQVTQCANPCEHCELCVGKTTLPDDCRMTPDAGTDGGGGTTYPKCDTGQIPCGPGTPTPANGCPANYGCVTGCCIPTGIIVG